MPGAVIAIDQDRPGGTSFGSPGVARKDLWRGKTVRPRCSTSGNTSFLWTLEKVPPGSSTEVEAGTEDQIACAWDPDTVGSYRLQLVTNGGGPGNIQILICAVSYDETGTVLERGWRIPAVGEGGNENNFGGQTEGWDEALRNILGDVRQNAFGGEGGGSAVGGDNGAPTRAARYTHHYDLRTRVNGEPSTGSNPVLGVALVDSLGETDKGPLLYYTDNGGVSPGIKVIELLKDLRTDVVTPDELGPIFPYGAFMMIVGATECSMLIAGDDQPSTITHPDDKTGFGGQALGVYAPGVGYVWYITSPADDVIYRCTLDSDWPTEEAQIAFAGGGATTTDPFGIVLDDDRNIWVAYKGGTPRVQKYIFDGDTGNLVGSGAAIVARIESNLVFDGKYLFGIDITGGTLVRITVADGTIVNLSGVTVDANSRLAFDGELLWMSGMNHVTSVHPVSFEIFTNLQVTAGDSIGQIVADPRTGVIYAAVPSNDFSGQSVLAYTPGHYHVLDGLRVRNIDYGKFAMASTNGGELIGTNNARHLDVTWIGPTHQYSGEITLGADDVTVLMDTSGGPGVLNLPSQGYPRIVIVKDSTGNADTNPIQLNPAGSDTIDGQSTYSMSEPFEAKIIQYFGTDWKIIGSFISGDGGGVGGGGSEDIQTFTAAGPFVWTKPAGTFSRVLVRIWGAGGGGGSGMQNGTDTGGGSGAGGGCHVEHWFSFADLDATVAGSVGAGGAGGLGSPTFNPGSDGGVTFFGDLLTAFGGGGGGQVGGSGGGAFAKGLNGVNPTTTFQTGGGGPFNNHPADASFAPAFGTGYDGASTGGTNSNGRPAIYGGGSGSSANSTGSAAGLAGGNSLFGGGGGGSAGGINGVGAAQAGGAGGFAGARSDGTIVGNGGAGGAAGIAGSAGASGVATRRGGAGGGGAGGRLLGVGLPGGAGGQPGGGGGGGGSNTGVGNASGSGGAGGDGLVIVHCFA